MIKKLFILFKIGRKLALSDALNIASKFHKPPFIVKIFFQILSLSFSNKNKVNFDIDEGKKTFKFITVHGHYLYKTWAIFSNQT